MIRLLLRASITLAFASSFSACSSSSSNTAPCTAMCGSTCTNLQADALNCGACGHSCLRGTCSAGACQSFVVATNLSTPRLIEVGVVFEQLTAYFSDTTGLRGADLKQMSSPFDVSSTPSIGGIATNATGVFWTVSTATGNVSRETGPRAEVLVSGQNAPGAVRVDAANLYWTNTSGMFAPVGTLMRAPIAGGAATTLSTGLFAPSFLMVDATTLYWINQTSMGTADVMSVPLAGGTPATLASGQNSPIATALTPARVYWLRNDAKVMSVAIGGGATDTVFAATDPTEISAAQTGGGIIADDTAVYVALTDVKRIPIGGGTPTVVATLKGTARGLAGNATALCWFDAQTGNAQVVCMAK